MIEPEATVIAAKLRLAWDIFKLGDREDYFDTFPGDTLTEKYVTICEVIRRIYEELPKFE